MSPLIFQTASFLFALLQNVSVLKFQCCFRLIGESIILNIIEKEDNWFIS